MKWITNEVRYSDLSDIRYRAQTAASVDGRFTVLILSYHGDLADGSAANSDTRYMGFVAGQYVSLVFPDCVVLDYRELGYSFGDSLFSVNAAIESEYDGLPVVYVASEKCLAGLTTLLAPAGYDTATFLFRDLGEAMDRAGELAKEFKDSGSK